MTKAFNQKCVLIIAADGFEEVEMIVWLSAMRQAGIWVKSVSLTSGLIHGAHGIHLKPDLVFADLDHLLKTAALRLLILPAGSQSLTKLETDPRVHQLLRQVAEQHGQIIATSESLPILQAAALWGHKSGETDYDQEGLILLRDPLIPLDAFVQTLIYQLLQPAGPKNNQAESKTKVSRPYITHKN